MSSAVVEASEAKPARFRPDIEGLRAIAIGSVLVYHAGIPWLSGGFAGVDVFFVISGFLITSLIVREVTRSGRLSLATFWARRARRLLPASAAVLAFSALVSFLVLPITDRKPFGGDIFSAAIYLVNWRLADREVDYLAENVGMSPVQHYWSLAVEEQFYVVWPLLIVAIVLLFRRLWKPAALTTLILVTVASFAWALHASVESPAAAFFVSTTRVWELGVGAILAVTFPFVSRLRPALLAALGWIGLLVLIGSLFLISDATIWPGPATLAPVLGTAALIASGSQPTNWSPSRLLSVGPAVWIGALSYSLYLWHWPILIAGQELIDEFRIRHGIALTLLAIIPAWLSYTYLENPIRHGARFASNGAALRLGVVTTVLSTYAAVALVASTAWATTTDPGDATQTAVGAGALLTSEGAATAWSELDTVEFMRPSPFNAPEDRPTVYTDPRGCTVGIQERAVRSCSYGQENAPRTLVIVGDSKILQWSDAIIDIAEESNWRVVIFSKSACSFADAMRLADGKLNPSCPWWSGQAVKQIIDLDPDLVVTSQRFSNAYPTGTTSLDGGYTRSAMVDGIVTRWTALANAGIPLIAVLDNPGPTDDVFECVAESSAQLSDCSFEKAPAIAGSGAPAALEAARRVNGTKVIDLGDVVCPEARRCAPVIGNVLVWRQTTHITNTYALSATPQLSDALAKATDGALGNPMGSKGEN